MVNLSYSFNGNKMYFDHQSIIKQSIKEKSKSLRFINKQFEYRYRVNKQLTNKEFNGKRITL